jgi:hypothetical protein
VSRVKESEHDKRAYMKSKLMEGIFRIKLEHINYEKKKSEMISLYIIQILTLISQNIGCNVNWILILETLILSV